MKLTALSLKDKVEGSFSDELPKNITVGELCLYGTNRELKKLGKFLIDVADKARITNEDDYEHFHFRTKVSVYPEIVVCRVKEKDANYQDVTHSNSGSCAMHTDEKLIQILIILKMKGWFEYSDGEFKDIYGILPDDLINQTSETIKDIYDDITMPC